MPGSLGGNSVVAAVDLVNRAGETLQRQGVGTIAVDERTKVSEWPCSRRPATLHWRDVY